VAHVDKHVKTLQEILTMVYCRKSNVGER